MLNFLLLGVGSKFDFIPVNYTIETALVVTDVAISSTRPERISIPANGVNAALFSYGDFVLARNNKQRNDDCVRLFILVD